MRVWEAGEGKTAGRRARAARADSIRTYNAELRSVILRFHTNEANSHEFVYQRQTLATTRKQSQVGGDHRPSMREFIYARKTDIACRLHPGAPASNTTTPDGTSEAREARAELPSPPKNKLAWSPPPLVMAHRYSTQGDDIEPLVRSRYEPTLSK